jgi:rubrerythrin
MRLIEADALREKAQWMEMPDNQGINFDVRAVSVSSIDLAPTIEAELVGHGRWEPLKKRFDGDIDWYRCSNCGKLIGGRVHYNYCPNCGKKMDLPN